MTLFVLADEKEALTYAAVGQFDEAWSCIAEGSAGMQTANWSTRFLRVGSSDAAWASTATCIKKLSIPNIIWVVSEKNFGNFLDRVLSDSEELSMLHTHQSFADLLHWVKPACAAFLRDRAKSSPVYVIFFDPVDSSA
jgi:hypothetical protein